MFGIFKGIVSLAKKVFIGMIKRKVNRVIQKPIKVLKTTQKIASIIKHSSNPSKEVVIFLLKETLRTNISNFAKKHILSQVLILR